VDVQDLHRVLAQIDGDLQKVFPGRLGKRALMGYSLGGFHTLMVAARAAEDRSALQFDRYLSINAPVRLMHGIEQLDSLYQAALEWPAHERTDRIEQLFVKLAALARGGDVGLAPPPLSSIETRFLLGLAFRINLRDLIFFTQSRHNQGVITQPLDRWKREPVYREIMNYSFADYMQRFLAPYYKKRGIDFQDEQTIQRATDLRSLESFFRSQPAVQLIANADDILLAPEDVRWMEQTFGDRLTLFPRGGHLGNLSETPVQAAILRALDGLTDEPGVISQARPPLKRQQSPRAYLAEGRDRGF
jgi:pimeloyl-ACP methyl ester carboxylesterase